MPPSAASSQLMATTVLSTHRPRTRSSTRTTGRVRALNPLAEISARKMACNASTAAHRTSRAIPSSSVAAASGGPFPLAEAVPTPIRPCAPTFDAALFPLPNYCSTLGFTECLYDPGQCTCYGYNNCDGGCDLVWNCLPVYGCPQARPHLGAECAGSESCMFQHCVLAEKCSGEVWQNDPLDGSTWACP